MHRSWCAEHPGNRSNERLEFLGDAVLGLVVTEHLYRSNPDLDEGPLTDLRKSVVSSVALASVAETLDVGAHLLLGRGEELSGGRAKPSILADAMEAIIGATFLALGLETTAEMVLRILADRLATAHSDGADHKSRLQELVAHRFGSAPRYSVESTGPDHDRTFHVTVTIDGVAHGEGVGRSKKAAEQAAARAAVTRLQEAEAPAPDADDTTSDPEDPGPLDDQRETNDG